MNDESLWGEISLKEKLETPLSILKVQGIALNKVTGGVLDGRVVSLRNAGSRFAYEFRITAPALGNYSATILTVGHTMTLYPTVVTNELTEQELQVSSPDDLREALKDIFQSEEVRRIVRGLAAQSLEAASPGG